MLSNSIREAGAHMCGTDDPGHDAVVLPKADEYLNDRMDSPHLSPKLIVEKPLIPSLTLCLFSDGQAKIQRWYDVTPSSLNRVGVKSIDFIPDGIARLVDRSGNEIYRSKVKLTDELDGLPIILAHIEKIWSHSTSPDDFWTQSCNLLIRYQVPSFQEIAPGAFRVTRAFHLEAACFWMAYLAKLRFDAGKQEWSALHSGAGLIPKFVGFYNQSPSRGPEIREPTYNPDRNRLHTLLEGVRKARTNEDKKQTLESLAEALIDGIPEFHVFPNKRTATGEIDRWVRNNSTYPQLSIFGPRILVECKNWQDTVGTDSVGALIADLEDAGLTCGLIFCRNGVSNDAKRRIVNFYQQKRGYVLVIEEEDIKIVCDGGNFAHILIQKADSVVFGR